MAVIKLEILSSAPNSEVSIARLFIQDDVRDKNDLLRGGGKVIKRICEMAKPLLSFTDHPCGIQLMINILFCPWLTSLVN